MEKSHGNTWLLKRDSKIQGLFIGIFMIGFTAGALRFLFPFQILNLGGTEALASLGGTCSAIGQVVSLIAISRLIRGQRSSLLVSGLLIAVFALATTLARNSSVLALSRLFEGAGAGLLILVIIRVSCEFESCRGESVGTLLSALFLGSAIGQGLAGVLVGYVSQFLSIVQTHAIQALGLVLFILSLAILGLMLPKLDQQASIAQDHKHFHITHFARTLLSRNVIILAGVYFLYDFSHGFYTPILSIVLNYNGVPIDQIGLGYLVGDMVWGIIQLYAGRLVDRIGHILPLVLSLVAKGVVVFFYATVSTIYSLIPILALAGAAEGFLEPARNDAAMEHSPSNGLFHDHPHYYLVRAPGASFSLAKHEHKHSHTTGSDEIVSVLQTIGILGFALGSGGGAWLLIREAALSTLVLVGGFMLILAGLLSITLYQKNAESTSA